MVSKKKNGSTSQLSILEAVEALEGIADLEFEKEVNTATKEEIRKQNSLVTAKAVKWLAVEDSDSTIKLIKETFHVVHEYLRDFYNNASGQQSGHEIEEGIKTIMVLAGEAAQKLDHYTTLFEKTKEHQVKNLREYKQLQEFYLTRIARKIDEGILGRWILELTKGAMEKRKEVKVPKLVPARPLSSKHVFMDMESVRKDTEYELFYMKKEDGTRFFNPRLIRNIRLICDFGESIKTEKRTDPLEDVPVWQDHAIYTAAKNIVSSLGGLLDRYFHEVKQSGRRELIGELNKAVFALIMCCNTKNLLRNFPVKNCTEYFQDFQYFLRRALRTREYQRYIVYPPKKAVRLVHTVLEMIHQLCRGLFVSVQGFHDLVPVLEKLLAEAVEAQSPEHIKAAKDAHTVWSRIASDYAAMKKLIKQHPYGPLVKDLAILEQGSYHQFDPIGQCNIPYQLYSLYVLEQKMTHLHLPSPTIQEFVNRAVLLDEFKGFLRASSKGQFQRTHLTINLQDKTSWREHARAVAVEDLQSVKEYADSLVVVTLAKETEFYHQMAPYNQDNHAEQFIQHFKQNLEDENCGFLFPKKIKKVLFPKFVDGVIDAIHRIFFSSMNVLTVKNRLDFIEIFYLFLELKLIEMVRPDSFSFTCKDAIDVGGVASAELYAFLSVLNKDGPNEKDIEHLNLILYTPSLLIRERLPNQEPFDRMIGALKRIEAVKEELGASMFQKVVKEAFGRYYKIPLIKSFEVIPSM